METCDFPKALSLHIIVAIVFPIVAIYHPKAYIFLRPYSLGYPLSSCAEPALPTLLRYMKGLRFTGSRVENVYLDLYLYILPLVKIPI